MTDAEQELHDRLERLEAGEALEEVLRGLEEDESELVQFAAQIIAIPKPVRKPAIVQSQKQKVMRAAQKRRGMSTLPFKWPFSFNKWFITASVFLILFATITGFYAGMNWLSSPAAPIPQEVASNETLPAPGTDTPLEETPENGIVQTPISTTQPQNALLFSVHGIVQVQNEEGGWNTVQVAELQTGQVFRTWSLSSAELIFFDGSVVTLEQNTVMTLETLQFQDSGARQIILYQPSGETHHEVVPTNAKSSYVVRTPNASGEAKGTSFQVAVRDEQNSSFAVVEGEVSVTGREATVQLSSGQITIVKEDATPSQPVSWIQGEGEVSDIGSTWIIDGMEFQMHDGTVVVGNPGMGDLVIVQGRLLADGIRLADHIEKQAFVFEHQFRLLGLVEAQGVSQWKIAGQEVYVNTDTLIDPNVGVGSRVLARGFFQANGEFLTMSIQALDDASAFKFSGLVENIHGELWTISEIPVVVNSATARSEEIHVGEIVYVTGRLLPDNIWEAVEIEKISIPGQFEFIGTVQTIAPWLVQGVSLAVNTQTHISPEIGVGAKVRVEGRVLEDGTWLASEIQNLAEGQKTLIFVGIVENVSPWVVNGTPLVETDQTIIVGEIQIFSLVRVYARILEDETWQILQIELLNEGTEIGCLEFSDAIASFDETVIVLQSGGTIPRTVAEISGTLLVESEVWVRICTGSNEEITFASLNILTDDEDTEVEPTALPPTPEDTVTICHIPSGNPNNAQTITVAASAVDAHLAHGDYLGPCQENGQNNGNNNGGGNGGGDGNGNGDDNGNSGNNGDGDNNGGNNGNGNDK